MYRWQTADNNKWNNRYLQE